MLLEEKQTADIQYYNYEVLDIYTPEYPRLKVEKKKNGFTDAE